MESRAKKFKTLLPMPGVLDPTIGGRRFASRFSCVLFVVCFSSLLFLLFSGARCRVIVGLRSPLFLLCLGALLCYLNSPHSGSPCGTGWVAYWLQRLANARKGRQKNDVGGQEKGARNGRTSVYRILQQDTLMHSCRHLQLQKENGRVRRGHSGPTGPAFLCVCVNKTSTLQVAGVVDCGLGADGLADRRQGITAARNGSAVAAVGKKREKSGTSSGRNA